MQKFVSRVLTKSVLQAGLSFGRPGLFVRQGQRIQVAWRGVRVVDPFAQERSAADDVDGALAMLVFVIEIAPQRIVRIEPAEGLERERLEAPGPERRMIVAR